MRAPKVMFIGLDAMDPGIANRLIDEGRLPVLAKLADTAFRATTTNPTGLLVGGCWPTVWSSTTPAAHGFYCFRQFQPGRYEVRRFTPVDIDVTPFWMPLAEAGRSVALFDVPLV
jgi:predicted AlkP superfamily phosphohydrolase/phosphomutase